MNAEERRLINIYRGIPDELKPLYLETGKLFSRTARRKERERQKIHEIHQENK